MGEEWQRDEQDRRARIATVKISDFVTELGP